MGPFEHIWQENALEDWANAGIIALATLVVLFLVRWFVVRRLAALAAKTQTRLDDLFAAALTRTRFVFLLVVSLYVGSLTLLLPDRLTLLANRTLILFLCLQLGVWASAAIREWSRLMTLEAGEDQGRSGSTTVLSLVGRVAVWSLLFLVILDNFGINVTALVTGLGIGGIAIALAVQNVLGDLLASLSILFDKPFVVGDAVVVDTFQGTVEHVGIKTTRVRSITGEQVIFSNTDLTKSRIRNYKRMTERRAAFTVGLVYGTPPDKLERAKVLLSEAVAAQEKARLDRCHFKAFGDSALLFEVVYFVTDPDLLLSMDVQERINLEVAKRFAAEGLTFAFPTQTLHLVQGGPGAR